MGGGNPIATTWHGAKYGVKFHVGYTTDKWKNSWMVKAIVIGGFEWLSINLSKSAAFLLQTENNLKPPYNQIKRHIKVQWNMATRGSHVHNSMVEC